MTHAKKPEQQVRDVQVLMGREISVYSEYKLKGGKGNSFASPWGLEKVALMDCKDLCDY